MLYRAILGFVPMIMIALFATGAIPLSSVVPTTEYRSSAVRAEEQAGDSRSTRKASGAAMSTGEVKEVFDSVDASLDAEIKRRAPREKESKDRIRRLHQMEQAPVPGGWGR